MSSTICSICKVLLTKTEDPTEFVCPDCGRVYLPAKEIVEYQEASFESSHSDEFPEVAGTGTGGVGIVAASDDEDMSLTDMLYKSPKHAPNRGEGANTWD